MKRSVRSLKQSSRAPRSSTPTPRLSASPVALTEPLENRMMMAADLSGGMINKFGGGTSYAPGIITAAGDGANGASSSGDSDDRLGAAHKKSLNFTANAEISSGLDVDLYRFSVKKGQRVTFDIDRPAFTALDSVLRLFNSAGQELAIGDDQGTSDEPKIAPGEVPSLESFIDYTFTTAGTYYVGVSGTANDGYNPVTGAGDLLSPSTGKYKLVVSKYINPDGNDTLQTADDHIGKNGSESHRISVPGDVDVFSLTVKKGDRIAFDTDSDLSSPLDTLDSYLRLFNANGVQLASNDDGDDPTEPAENVGSSYFEYTFTQSGTYYVAVSGKGNETYNPLTGDGETDGDTGHYVLHTALLS